MLEISNITVKYKNSKRIVLDNVSVTADNGNFTVITGESGSGKSTLLAVAGGYLKPSEGDVKLNNTSLFSLNDKELSKLHNTNIGYIPQSNIMIKGFTALENITAALQFSDNNCNAAEINKKAMDILDELEIKQLYDRYPYELSGGEQKRIAVARAVLMEPELLIADEPTTGLDKRTAVLVSEYFSEYCKKGHTVMIASHDDTAINYGHFIFSIDKGKIQKI